MKINIIIFGQLCELLGDNLVVNDVADTNEMITELNKRFPGLSSSKYVIAVNKNLIIDNTELSDNTTVALLPPFSGG